jgi:hypothetical protein
MLRHERSQPREAKHLVVWIMGLYQPIALEQDAVLLAQRGFFLLIAHLSGISPKGIPLARRSLVPSP